MEIMTQAGPIVAQETAQAAPVAAEHTQATPRLRDSHFASPPIDLGNGIISVTITADTPYAQFVAGGTSAHEIRARTPPKPLRFKVGGQVVYAMRVNHPGTTANAAWWSTQVLGDRFRGALAQVSS